MSISASLVKELRERTGAGVLDCQKALKEVSGDVEQAIDWLRKKGFSSAAKKAGRVSAEGLISVSVEGNKGVVLEVNTETDFVGRNEKFQEYVRTISSLCLAVGGDLEQLKSHFYPQTQRTVEEELTSLIATIGENMVLRRSSALSVSKGVVASYVHSAVSPGLGRIGVVLALESESSDSDRLKELARQLAMHVAANNPQVVNLEDITSEQKAHERTVLEDQVRVSMERIESFVISAIVPKTPGVLTLSEVNKVQFEEKSTVLAKAIRASMGGEQTVSMEKIKELASSAEIIQQTVEADLDKFVNNSVLSEQSFVMNPGKNVREILEEASQKLASPVFVKSFIRYELGEGIEKKKENFAEEVAAQL